MACSYCTIEPSAGAAGIKQPTVYPEIGPLLGLRCPFAVPQDLAGLGTLATTVSDAYLFPMA